MKTTAGKLFNALLGKTGSFGRTLTGFELGIGFADHVFRAFAADDLAISVTALSGSKGRKNSHDRNWLEIWLPTRRRGAESRKSSGFVKRFLLLPRFFT
jgi:hypothetical protein